MKNGTITINNKAFGLLTSPDGFEALFPEFRRVSDRGHIEECCFKAQDLDCSGEKFNVEVRFWQGYLSQVDFVPVDYMVNGMDRSNDICNTWLGELLEWPHEQSSDRAYLEYSWGLIGIEQDASSKPRSTIVIDYNFMKG